MGLAHLSLDKDSPLSRTGQGVFFAVQSSADCITNMSGFDLRQTQAAHHLPANPQVDEEPIDRLGCRQFPLALPALHGAAPIAVAKIVMWLRKALLPRKPVLRFPRYAEGPPSRGPPGG